MKNKRHIFFPQITQMLAEIPQIFLGTDLRDFSEDLRDQREKTFTGALGSAHSPLIYFKFNHR